jgi:hypothetical protein
LLAVGFRRLARRAPISRFNSPFLSRRAAPDRQIARQEHAGSCRGQRAAYCCDHPRPGGVFLLLTSEVSLAGCWLHLPPGLSRLDRSGSIFRRCPLTRRPRGQRLLPRATPPARRVVTRQDCGLGVSLVSGWLCYAGRERPTLAYWPPSECVALPIAIR